MKRLVCLLLAVGVMAAMMTGCRKPESSGNGDNLTPTGNITATQK